MISVDALSKRFGQIRAVDRISFRVARGEMFGFLGPNGAGKTTTISMVCGLLRPDEGTVLIGEFNLWESPKAAKRLLGLVPQEAAFYEEFSARENLLFWGGLYGAPRAELKKSVDAILERVGLAERAREPVSRFSGGMKRRLNLAIGLVHRPQVLLLDEPTVGIDPQARNNILDIIREMAREGTTILFTTHHLEEAEKLCDRIAIMDHGKVIALGTPRELIASIGVEHVVEFSAGSAAKPLDISALRRMEGVRDVRGENGSVQMQVTQLHRAVPALLDELSRQGVPLTELRTHSASLEDVFVTLTGRHLRDE